MDKKTCKIILENKKKFVPVIFTNRQFSIVKKYVEGKDLTSTEKTYLYTSIKKKMDALGVLKEENHIIGRHMILKRIIEAKEILSEISGDAFISGSFLFKEKYNDIDIYIISKRRKQYTKGNKHFIHITLSDLNKPIFASAALYCVANFSLPIIKVPRKRFGMQDTLMAYQRSIIEYLEGDGFKTLKYLLMEYYLVLKDKVLDSYELTKLYESVCKSSDAIEKINEIFKRLMLFSYSKRYLYDELVKFTKDFPQLIKDYKANENLVIYKKLYDEIKDECRGVKT